MIKVFLQIAGWLIAHTPERLLAGLAQGVGSRVLTLLPRRRRLLYSNLHHAFPERSAAWRRGIAHELSRRLAETAFLSLAAPFFSEQRIRSMVALSPEGDAWFGRQHAEPFPFVIATIHVTYWESLTWLKLFSSTPFPEFGVIFRPLNHQGADAWVKSTRERFGMKLLSRKSGLQEAFKLLKRKGGIGLLFDQNAGMQGALTTVCGRVCSTSELVGLMAEKYGAKVIVVYPVRLGFWKMRFEVVPLANLASAAAVTVELNQWFENAMATDDNLCASWLWSHDRWRNQDVPERRFRLEAKRNLLAAELEQRGLAQLPRKTRIWIRLPNWLGDVVMALPLLRALRLSRPDAEITLIAKSTFGAFLKALDVADRIEALPSRGRGYFRHFWRKRREYPDVYVLLTHSTRGDLEAWLTRAPQRFGVVGPGKSRTLLTHGYSVPAELAGKTHHQLEIWEAFFRHFGLSGEVERNSFTWENQSSAPTHERADRPAPIFGLIAGSENNPEKRWPVEYWRTVIVALSTEFPQATFILFGTAKDRAITSQISLGLAAEVIDLAGKTDLLAFAGELRRCTLLISNDTGGMHLANALGVPLIAVFGPTNPVRTAPIFSALVEIVQPPNCPPTGGGQLSELRPEQVLSAIHRILPSTLARA